MLIVIFILTLVFILAYLISLISLLIYVKKYHQQEWERTAMPTFIDNSLKAMSGPAGFKANVVPAIESSINIERNLLPFLFSFENFGDPNLSKRRKITALLFVLGILSFIILFFKVWFAK